MKANLLLSSLLALTLAGGAFAQDAATAPTEAPAEASAETPAATDGLSMGREADDGPGSVYVQATHGDWEQRCIRTEDGSNPCQLYQLLFDADQNPVAEFSLITLPEGQEAAAGATVIVPLDTLLTGELTISVDTGAARKYPFSWCSPMGCVARLGFTADEVAAMKKGNKINVSIVPVVAPTEVVTVAASLKGFTAGFDALKAMPQ